MVNILRKIEKIAHFIVIVSISFIFVGGASLPPSPGVIEISPPDNTQLALMVKQMETYYEDYISGSHKNLRVRPPKILIHIGEEGDSEATKCGCFGRYRPGSSVLNINIVHRADAPPLEIIILHEYIHYLQDLDGRFEGFYNKALIEEEAYVGASVIYEFLREAIPGFKLDIGKL